MVDMLEDKDFVHRDALARVIDPDAWDLFDDPRIKTDRIRAEIVADSRDMATRIMQSGLMESLDWDSKEFQRAKQDIIERTSRTGHCHNVEDGMDGYQKHDPRCPDWPNGHGGSICI